MGHGSEPFLGSKPGGTEGALATMATYEEFLAANAKRAGKTAINQRGPDGMFDQVHSKMTQAIKDVTDFNQAFEGAYGKKGNGCDEEHETCSLHDSDGDDDEDADLRALREKRIQEMRRQHEEAMVNRGKG